VVKSFILHATNVEKILKVFFFLNFENFQIKTKDRILGYMLLTRTFSPLGFTNLNFLSKLLVQFHQVL